MALVLTRRPGEAIHLMNQNDKSITTMTVLGVKGNQVRMAFTAGDHINIVRNELVKEEKTDDGNP